MKTDETIKRIEGIRVKSEKMMLREVEERQKKYEEGKSKDGYIEAGCEEFEYKGVKYFIKILQYFTMFPPRLISIGGLGRISSMHAVVEFPDETKELVDEYGNLTGNYSEFLYHDTLHSWNDKQTIEEQVRVCMDLAKTDIDGIPDLINSKEEKIKEFRKKYPRLVEHDK